jgi:hypothetical protein
MGITDCAIGTEHTQVKQFQGDYASVADPGVDLSITPR